MDMRFVAELEKQGFLKPQAGNESAGGISPYVNILRSAKLPPLSIRLAKLFGAADEIIPHRAQSVRRVDLLVLDGGFGIAGPGGIAGCGGHELDARRFL